MTKERTAPASSGAAVAKRFRRLALALVSALALAPPASAQTEPASETEPAPLIDLSAIDIFVRPGFQNEWTFRLPDPGSMVWTRVAGNPGKRSIVMGKLGMEGVPKPPILPLKRLTPEKFCAVMDFTATDRLLESKSGVALYLARIGQNWDVYVNGTMVATESYIDENGNMTRERAVRGALVPIDKRYLVLGKNVLAFRIVGDPVDPRTGFIAAGPYVVGPYEDLAALKREYADLMLIGIYFFFAVYHVLLFVLRPRSASYLIYGLGALLLSVFFLCGSFIIYSLVPDTALIWHVELACLFMLFPVFIAFFDSVLKKRFSKITLVSGAIYLALAVAQFFVLTEAIYRIWRLTLPLLIGYFVVVDLVIPLSSKMRHYRRAVKGKGPFAWLAAFGRTVARTNAGQLFVGFAVVAAAVLLDALAGDTGRAASFSKSGFFLLIIGTATILASQFIKIYHDIERLNLALENRVADRTRDLEAVMSEETELSEKLAAMNAKLQGAAEAGARDMRLAVQVQQGFFPKTVPDVDGWDVSYVFMPASGVSGDFYDFYVNGRELEGILLGDVSGHGIASGLVTVIARSVFHRVFSANSGASLGKLMETANAELIRELAMVENYLTAILVRVRDGVVEYSNAAHPDAYYKRAGRPKVSILKPREDDYKGAIMGREGFETPYKTIRFRMETGDSILIYTDCLNESKNVEGEMFGDEGVAQAFSSAPDGTAQQILDFVMQEWRFHVSGARIADDLTAILIKKT